MLNLTRKITEKYQTNELYAEACPIKLGRSCKGLNIDHAYKKIRQYFNYVSTIISHI